MVTVLNEPDHKRKRIYTTGQVAKCLRVAPRTVSKWFDAGYLEGYRLPYSEDRRIPRECLVRFMIKHNIPMSHLGSDHSRLLLVGVEPFVQDAIRSQIPIDEIWIERSDDIISASMQLVDYAPSLIIVDEIASGREMAVQFAYIVNGRLPQTKIMGVFGEDTGKDFIARHQTSGAYLHIFQRPFDVKHMIDKIVSMQLDA